MRFDLREKKISSGLSVVFMRRTALRLLQPTFCRLGPSNYFIQYASPNTLIKLAAEATSWRLLLMH